MQTNWMSSNEWKPQISTFFSKTKKWAILIFLLKNTDSSSVMPIVFQKPVVVSLYAKNCAILIFILRNSAFSWFLKKLLTEEKYYWHFFIKRIWVTDTSRKNIDLQSSYTHSVFLQLNFLGVFEKCCWHQ